MSRAASLAALARGPVAAAWAEVRSDPGAVLLLLRHLPVDLAPANLSFFPALVSDPAVLERAVCRLDHPGPGFVDWNQPPVRPIYQGSLTLARLSVCLAERTGRCDPDHAWVAGLLAPLGCLAVCAVDGQAAGGCLDDPEFSSDPVGVQQRWWGLDQAGIARRLARHWQLPRWLAAVVGCLELPVATALSLGADPDLFPLVQLAVALARGHGVAFHLGRGAGKADSAAALGLSAADLESLEAELVSWQKPAAAPRAWSDPQVPLLRDLLLLAADNRRLGRGPVVEGLETEVDELQRALRDQANNEQERLRAQKLAALAEFAAGAGHEINNPLAVISGHAQYLLHHEADPGRQRALQAIIGQTQRIHLMLSDLMQFARPPRPQKQKVDVAALVAEVAGSLSDIAAQRRLQVLSPPSGHPVWLLADPRQVRTAVACLLRNAIEAAPIEGWAGVRLETPGPDRLDIVVEDNGPGPEPDQRSHLFDPFYSGRPAGRGRGLGLSTAWRLAREHGGDVRFEPTPDGPTRFVLSLPREPGCNGSTNGCDDLHHRLAVAAVPPHEQPQP